MLTWKRNDKIQIKQIINGKKPSKEKNEPPVKSDDSCVPPPARKQCYTDAKFVRDAETKKMEDNKFKKGEKSKHEQPDHCATRKHTSHHEDDHLNLQHKKRNALTPTLICFNECSAWEQRQERVREEKERERERETETTHLQPRLPTPLHSRCATLVCAVSFLQIKSGEIWLTPTQKYRVLDAVN